MFYSPQRRELSMKSKQCAAMSSSHDSIHSLKTHSIHKPFERNWPLFLPQFHVSTIQSSTCCRRTTHTNRILIQTLQFHPEFWNYKTNSIECIIRNTNLVFSLIYTENPNTLLTMYKIPTVFDVEIHRTCRGFPADDRFK